jgi:hypothetical protein
MMGRFAAGQHIGSDTANIIPTLGLIQLVPVVCPPQAAAHWHASDEEAA